MLRILSNEYRSNLPNEPSVAHGGPATFAHTFSQYVSAQGHEWIGIVQNRHSATTTSIRKEASIQGRTYYQCYLPDSCIQVSMRGKKKQDPRILFNQELAAIQKFIRRVKPDVLFLNGFSLYAWLLLEAASQAGLPIIIQHAGIARIEFDLYKHLYSRAGRAMMLEMERDIVSAACTQIFLNEYSRDIFSSVVAPVPQAQSLIIPLPYLHTYSDAGTRGATMQDPHQPSVVIGCVARWDRIKNHKALLKLAQEAKRQGLNWTFKSVTQIPDSVVQVRFKNAYRKTIDVIAPMDRDALAAFYQSVNMLVLPSIFDVSPTVVMEATLIGRQTLIAPGVGWNSEYRDHGLAHWITDFSDPVLVVKKIQKLLKEKPSDQFLHMIRTKHAPKTVFDAYIHAFINAKTICA